MTVLARLLLLVAAAFALVMAILPAPPVLPMPVSDKLQHMLAFAVLAGLACLAFPRRSPLLLFSGLALFGGLIELAQALPVVQRQADLLDWLADLGAAALVLAVAHIWRRRATAAALASR